MIDSRDVGPGDLFVGLPRRARRRRALRRRRRSRPAPGACWSRRSTRERRRAARAGAVLAADDPLAALQRLARAWRRRARRARSIGDHRLDRQDLDEGHPRRAARAAPRDARLARELQHRDRPAARRARGRARGTEALVLELAMRGAGPDRRAGRDRRARRRRDRQRRPGPPGAAGLAGGDRRGQGRADRGPARRAATAVVPADEPLLAPHLRDDVDDRHVRRRRRRAARRARTATRVTHRRAGDRLELELRFTQAYHRAQPARRGRRGAWRSGSRPDGRVEVAFSPLRGERRGARGRGRSSSTTATTPTRCRCARPWTTSPSAEPAARVAVLGDMLELGPDERALPRRDRRATPPTAAWTCSSPSARSRAAMAGGVRRRGPRRRRRRRGRRARCPRCSSPATSCWSRARAASGSRSSPRRCASASRPDAMGQVLIAGTAVAAHLHLPVAEVHRVPARPRVRPEHPRRRARRATTRRRARRRWAAIILVTAIAVPFLVLGGAEAAVAGGVRGGAGVRGARLRRRLDEDHQAPLARPAGADEAAGHDR